MTHQDLLMKRYWRGFDRSVSILVLSANAHVRYLWSTLLYISEKYHVRSGNHHVDTLPGITENDTKKQVDIYRGEDESGWILEVINEANASAIWDEPFDTGRETLDAVLIVIERDGIRSFLDGEYELIQ